MAMPSPTKSNRVQQPPAEAKSIGAQQSARAKSIGAQQPTTKDGRDESLAPKSVKNPPEAASKSLDKKPDKEIPPGRLTCALVFAVLAAGLGSSFVFGYNIGVMNGAGTTVKRWIAQTEGLRLQRYQNATDDELKNMTDDEFLEKLAKPSENAEHIKLTLIWSWVVGIFPLGGMFGGLSSGFVADHFGRKGGMLLNNILTFAAAIIMMASKPAGKYAMLILGRFLIGVSAGLSSGLAPMYLSEISPVNYRGLLGSVNQLMVTISILVSNVIGLPSALGNSNLWSVLLLLTIVPSIYQLINMPFCPESPKYLFITKGQHDLAKNALVKLRQTEDVEIELQKMQEEAEKIKNAPKITLGDMFKDKVMRRTLLIVVMMMLSQQLSGINATMFYSTQIFKTDAKLSPKTATGATMGMMTVNVLMTVVSSVLVDRSGRRTLQLTGLAGMFVSTIFLVIFLHLSGVKVQQSLSPGSLSTGLEQGNETAYEITELPSSTLGADIQEVAKYPWAAYCSIVFVVGFVIAFATGPGPIPWFYVSECFTQNARGKANSIAVGANWFAAFMVGLSFPPVQVAMKEYSFLIFSFFLLVFFFFTFIFVPETKGKTVDQGLSDLQKQLV